MHVTQFLGFFYSINFLSSILLWYYFMDVINCGITSWINLLEPGINFASTFYFLECDNNSGFIFECDNIIGRNRQVTPRNMLILTRNLWFLLGIVLLDPKPKTYTSNSLFPNSVLNVWKKKVDGIGHCFYFAGTLFRDLAKDRSSQKSSTRVSKSYRSLCNDILLKLLQFVLKSSRLTKNQKYSLKKGDIRLVKFL